MFALSAFLMIIAVSGCTTFAPYSASVAFPAEKDYKILGRVDYEGTAGVASYHKLLEVAKQKYPSTDDVVNIIVDAKRTSFFFATSDTFTMSGVAIEYTK